MYDFEPVVLVDQSYCSGLELKGKPCNVYLLALELSAMTTAILGSKLMHSP